jgi:hypothetical protein
MSLPNHSLKPTALSGAQISGLTRIAVCHLAKVLIPHPPSG